MGNLVVEIEESEVDYNRYLNGLLEDEGMAVNRAEIKAKTSDQYVRYQLAKGYLVVTQEMIRALKYRCRALSAEMEASVNL